MEVVKAEGQQRQGQQQQQQQQEPVMSLVTLTLDRGLPFDHALQMLLLAEGGGGASRREWFLSPP